MRPGPFNLGRRLKPTLHVTALVLALSTTAFGVERIAESQSPLMAAIVLNFARFADWPANRFASPTAPIVLCADPSDHLTASLASLDGEAVGARRVSVRRAPLEEFDAACHLAYVGSRGSPVRLQALERDGVLVVGEGEDFARVGEIGLVRVGREIRFEVNDSIARRSGIKLSSKLLRLALAVR